MIKPSTGIPLKNSNRTKALNIFNKNEELEPWFGIEHEYFIIDPKTNLPLGFTHGLVPSSQGIYYCGVGLMLFHDDMSFFLYFSRHKDSYVHDVY
jgi:glutamine synthetase